MKARHEMSVTTPSSSGNAQSVTWFTLQFTRHLSLVMSMGVCLLCTGCLDEDAQDELPPYTESYSEDGGMYQPVMPQGSSGYGSGSGFGSGSGSGSGSGAGAIPAASGSGSGSQRVITQFESSFDDAHPSFEPQGNPEFEDEIETDIRTEFEAEYEAEYEVNHKPNSKSGPYADCTKKSMDQDIERVGDLTTCDRTRLSTSIVRGEYE